MDLYDKILETKAYIRAKTNLIPSLGVILGSGLDGLTDKMQDVVTFTFSELPHFIQNLTQGHVGKIWLGRLGHQIIMVMKGRFHYYEGHTLAEITFPIRVMKALGVETLILSNACGAVNQNFQVGTMMLITDHLNLTGNNPLIGKNDERLGPRFPDASEIYSLKLRELTKNIAKTLSIQIQEGVYAWWSGPSYETPAEIRMIRFLGADAVGMSTVPEALVASQMGMQVLGLSCLTNMASGILPQKLSHQEVLAAANLISNDFGRLLYQVVLSL